MKRSLEQTLEAIYDSEIHAGLCWLWDGGYECWLGLRNYDPAAGMSEIHAVAPGFDPKAVLNRIRAFGIVTKIEDVADWFHEQVMLHYPDSHYADLFGNAKPSTH